MTNADVLLTHDIRYLLQNGYKDINPRPKYADGTPAHTLSVNHNVRKYNLQTEFPICSLRPIAWKSAIKEVLAIYQNQSNKILEFERYGCNWWKDWELPDGTIGKSYPYNLESHRPNEMRRLIVKVEPRIVPIEKAKIKTIKVDTISDTYIERYKNYQLLEKKRDGKNYKYLLQSLETGEKQLVSATCYNKIKNEETDNIKKNSKFLYDRKYYGVGYLGNYTSVKNYTNKQIDALKIKWINMLKRCYSNDEYYKQYYGNTYVATEWHSFEQFLLDVRWLPQFHLAKENNFHGWDLDKDYYSSNMYSKDTCVFLTQKDNKMYRVSKPIKAIHPNGNVELIINLATFCNEHNLNYGNAQMVLQGKRTHVQNYHFEYLDDEENTYRYELSKNQLRYLIQHIKDDPYSRRHIISFWNWANIDKKALVECAYETIWNVRGEYLDMMLVQRSGDMLVASGAGGINEVQYAALQMMIAKTTGYKPGMFTHVVANEQIYDRHMEQANELIKRADDQLKIREESPYCYYDITDTRLEFNPKTDNFYDFTIDDFIIRNYSPIKPQLTLDLGI